MLQTTQESRTFTLHAATAEERQIIYRMRHDVYAAELGQHPQNAEGLLCDALDAFNEYIVAKVGGRIAGFVSITPPGHGRYSIDKYFARDQLPFACDEAYGDYVKPGESLERFAAASENVAVVKSMSKVYALSGLRAAYLRAPAELARPRRSITPPWSVSLPAQIAAVAALADPAYYQARYEETHRFRKHLAEALEALGVRIVAPGSANFLLCRLPADGPNAATVLERCRARGLFLRDVSSMTAQVESRLFRIAVKDEETNRRMMGMLRDVLESLGE